MRKEKYLADLKDIDHELPLFKNSTQYASSDWREFGDLTVVWPIQRKLTTHECVWDFDHVNEFEMKMINNWLAQVGFKFISWQSSPSGMHIHFWTKVHGKEQKKMLTEYLAEQLEKRFGLKNDLGPMGHGHIRTEFSIHPRKGNVKEFLMSTVSPLFPFNDIPDEIYLKVTNFDPKSVKIKGKVGENEEGEIPSCMKYIIGHKFADGRERLTFALISWYKASGHTNDEIFDLVYEWCKRQDYRIMPWQLKGKIATSSGQVGCTYRHRILEELGVDMAKCHWESK